MHITTDYGVVNAEIVSEDVMEQRTANMLASATVAGYGPDGAYYRVLAKAWPEKDEYGMVVGYAYDPMPLAHRHHGSR